MARPNSMKATWLSVLWASFGLILCGWIISLAGVASLQAICSAPRLAAAGNRLPSGGALALSAATRMNFLNPMGCRSYFRWWWWIWAFETIIVFVPLSLIAGSLYRGMHSGWIGVLAVKAVLNFMATNEALDFADAVDGVDRGYSSRAKCLLSGFAISAAADVAMIFALAGTAWAHRHDDDYAMPSNQSRGVPAGEPPHPSAAVA